MKLGLDSLASLPASIARPAYDPLRARIGIVHLGTGNFHRAHQALATDLAMADGPEHWGIAGVNLRSPTLAAALQPQDGLYTLLERDGAGTRARVIGCLRRLLVQQREPQAVTQAIADPAVHVVSLTVTEKGYSGSTLEVLEAGLHARWLQGGRPLTLLSCDNLADNGRKLHGLIVALADQRRRPDFVSWLRSDVGAPSTVVDRIVPATTDADRALARESHGLVDAWPVTAEPFLQWVIEDRFTAPRPAWERCPGVRLTTDAAGWTTMKLGLLNAAHTAIACVGLAANWASVGEAYGQPALRRFVDRLWRAELVPALPAAMVPEVDSYLASLRERFANPALVHPTAQIVNDTSLKIPLRFGPALAFGRAHGRPLPCLALAIAAWLYCLREPTRRARFSDPDGQRLGEACARESCDAQAAARALLSQSRIFGTLGVDEAFVATVASTLTAIENAGVPRVLAALSPNDRS